MANKLMILGDSILKGVMYDSSRNRYSLYDDKWFIEETERRGMPARKQCRMGATVDYGLEHAESIASGDAVLIELGGNDSNYNWSTVGEAPDEEHAPATPPERFREMYKRLILKVRSLGGEPIAANLIPIDSAAFFKWIARTADGAGVLKWLGDENMLYRWHEYYSRIVEEVAAETGCRLLDLRSKLLTNHGYAHMLCGDGLHPNSDGHRLIRELLLDAVF